MEKVDKKVKVRKKTKISIEGYSHFSYFRQYADISIDHLNQILEMHGFRKIHKAKKKEVIDAVDSIELMDPSRSTLVEEDDQAKSCRAFLTMEEAVSDLADLNWQECSVTSLETLNLNPLFSTNLISNVNKGLHNDSAPIQKRKRSRRKMLSLNGLGNHNAPPAFTTRTGNGFGFVSASGNVRKKLPCRRKMLVRSDDEVDDDNFESTTAMMQRIWPKGVRSKDEAGTAFC